MTRLQKEKKQLLVLIAIWTVGAATLTYYFVLAPFLERRGRSSKELDELNQNIQKARLAVQEEPRVRKEHEQAMADLRRAMSEYIAPPESPLSWVSEKVYSLARTVGVNIRSITPQRVADTTWDALIKEGRYLRPYAVQITMECSYDNLREFVRALEESNPYLALTGITVLGQDQNVMRHAVTLRVEWPMWGRPLRIEIPDEAAATEESSPAGRS